MTYVPKLASERYMDPHEAGFDSCVYCSVAMLADAAMGKPVTTPQALEAIDDPNRMKVGTTMPAALAALAGTSATARKAITYLDGQNDTIDGLLASGEGLAVTGLYSALPAHYQRWDPAFAAKGSKSGHAMYIQRDGPNGPKAKNVWLLDPLAEPGYAGEWLPTEALHAFIATRVQHAAAPIAAPPEDDMTITRLKAEDWRPVAGHGVWRHTPDRSQLPAGHIADDTVTRTLAEITTVDGPDGDWRVTLVDGQLAYLLRSDWTPLTQGGDPAVQAQLTDFVARKEPSFTGRQVTVTSSADLHVNVS